MKKILTAALLSGAIALTTNTVEAQSVNVVLRAYFVLNGLRQTGSGAVAVRITNKDVVAALRATGSFSFSSGAQIILRSTDDQLPVVLVRDSNGSTTDVSSYLSLTDSGNEIHTGNNLVSWAIWNYDLNTSSGTDFHISGMVTLYRGPISSPHGTLTRVFNATAHVYGEGDAGGSPAVFYGAVYAGYPTAE